MQSYVFDLYGTLVDIRTDESSQAFRHSFLNEWQDVFGDTDFFEQYEMLLREETEGTPDREPDVGRVFDRIAASRGVCLDDEGIRRVAERFRTLSRHKLALYPGVPEMLADLRASGAGVYILSNAQHLFTMPEICSLGLDRMVDGIELSSDFGYKKPSPMFFHHILSKYGLLPDTTVYVGNDLSADVVGSRCVGLTSVYIHTDISPVEDTPAAAAALAHHVAADHAALAALLLSLRH